MYSCHPLLISSSSVRSILFLVWALISLSWSEKSIHPISGTRIALEMSTWPSWTNKCKGYFLWDFRGNASLPLLKARKGTFSSDCHGKRMFQTVKPFLEPEPGANLKKRSDTKDGQKVFKPMEPWSMWWISESNFTRRYMPLNHQSLSQQMPLFAYASFRWFFFFFFWHIDILSGRL